MQNGMIYGNSDSQAGTKKVAIIGGGLVGSLCASFFARRGYYVHLYEYREDIRTSDTVKGRSINLAMSVRARAALRELDLEDIMIMKHGIPMKARMIHTKNGQTYPIPYDAVHNQCIYSVSRKHLNEVLLTAAERFSNVKVFFQHKLISANLDKGLLMFLRMDNQETVTEEVDLIIGADGAYSSLRKEFMKQSRFDFSQEYIKHGYLELCINPDEDGNFAMKPNYLHIWPRGAFMMIALPNQDRTWTVTLFMPFEHFGKLSTPEALCRFFYDNFPDALKLIGREKLINDFFASKPSSLISIKCSPYHIGTKALLIGDAAHAMVPFYGQGMNAGFEDCRLLDELLTKYNDDLTKVLPKFSEIRNPDAEAICDLAMYNYIEMRDLVNRRSFLMRKKLDNILYYLFPRLWVPLYNSVTFSEMRYSDCIKNKKWQDEFIVGTAKVLGILFLCIMIYNIFIATR